ncbi:cobalamin-binding protein [Stakelama sediminis]|uniref:Iron complex transport system substrate-binding protein n=1 Tax=Stakelama sediminis TaxID=463200 RepID=A0A840YVB8_9SPHN|nr:cobalamin-binding protein [Stakelama sediminis]MBB5717641.1 iron complex transport system substrate-binding protein [Stakelama sediminis]
MQGAGSRIVSLLPSATEIAVALGFGDALVGRSHECDWPDGVSALPPVTRSKLEKGLTSRAIEDRVQEIVASGLSVYEVDAALLRRLDPQVILTQTQCAVCAVTPDDLTQALNDWTGAKPDLVSLAPDDLSDVWGDVRRVADALDAPEAGERLVTELQARLASVAAVVEGRSRPKVAAIEWMDPLMVAGNWVPELIDVAGGESVLATPGQHSPWIGWEALAEADPDMLVLMPCGYRIAQTLAELPTLAADPRWQDLRAVRSGQVFVTDGQYFFNRPGPRLIESAEILAEIAHPDIARFGHEGTAWIRASKTVEAASCA